MSFLCLFNAVDKGWIYTFMLFTCLTKFSFLGHSTMSAFTTEVTNNDTVSVSEVSDSGDFGTCLMVILVIIEVLTLVVCLIMSLKLEIGIFGDIFIVIIACIALLTTALLLTFAYPANQDNCLAKMIIVRALFSFVHTTFATTAYLRYKMFEDPVTSNRMDISKTRRNIAILYIIDFVINLVTSIFDQQHMFVLRCANIEIKGDDEDDFYAIPRVIFFAVRLTVLLTASVLDFFSVKRIRKWNQSALERNANALLASYALPMMTGLLPPVSLAIMFIIVGIAGNVTDWQNFAMDLINCAIAHSILLIGCLVIGTFLSKQTVDMRRNQRNTQIRIEEARPQIPTTRRRRALDQRQEELHHQPEETLEGYVQPVKEVPHQQNQVKVQVEVEVHVGETLKIDEFNLNIKRFLDEIGTFRFIDDDEVEDVKV